MGPEACDVIADLFWDAVTSTTALMIVAAVLIAALIVSHLPLMKMIPSVAPYIILAGFVSYLALADLALCIGFRISDERAETQRLKIELAWRENELEQQKATAEDAARIAKEKSAEADELKTKVDDYEATLAKQPVGTCALDDADVGGLRAFRATAKHQRADPKGLRGLGRLRGAP
jgi:hypothetical protein